MEKEVIARYILDFQERKLPALIPRELIMTLMIWARENGN